MEYTVKLRSPYEFERAVRPYQTGDEIDISENCEDLGSGRGGNWLEQTPDKSLRIAQAIDMIKKNNLC